MKERFSGNKEKRGMKFHFYIFLFAFLLIFKASAAMGQQLDPLLILMPKGELFEAAKNGLMNELKYEFALSTMNVNEGTSIEAIDAQITAVSPRAVVLMGNRSITIYAQYVHGYKNKTASLSVLAILALDVKRASTGIENVQCIAYETPMVTALVNFRRVMKQSLESVGVVYRKPFEEFVAKHTEYCKKEKIFVKSIMISDDASAHKKEISKALQQLVQKEQVQAFWVPNDNILLKPELLMDVWLPVFKKFKVPVIVGVESLVRPEIDFGTYAVMPDPQSMGEQTAGLITDLKEQNWRNFGTVIYPAISMYSVLNLKKAALFVDIKSININGITKVLKEEKKQ
jgi:hypothetical protein